MDQCVVAVLLWAQPVPAWELDEYRALYADKLQPREYGAMLMKRYAERAGISTRGSV